MTDVLDGPAPRLTTEGVRRIARGDVLKVRPPLVWDETHVDVFVDSLARAMADVTSRG